MSGIEALPLVHAFARSDIAGERALFVRVYLDLVAERARRGEAAPDDWGGAWRTCLEKAAQGERDQYVAELAKRQAPSQPAVGEKALASATREEIDAILARDDLDLLIALAGERASRLRPEHSGAMVARAREILDRSGDRRLAEALLSRDPIRLEAASLFMAANSEQRWAIMLAAQRADLGRKPAGAAALDRDAAARLEFSAIAGDPGEFAGVLAGAIGAPLELATQIATDPSGEPLAVALVAVGAPRDLCVRILTAADIHDGDGFPRIHALARLSDQLSVPAARRILAAILGLPRGVTPSLGAPATRQAAHPSPFVRRPGPSRATSFSRERPEPSAQDSRRP